MISEFQNEYRWLSNFAPVIVVLDEVEYPSVEQAYMSAKSDEAVWKEFCAAADINPKWVKKLSTLIVVKPDWELMKLEVMKSCLVQKYNTEHYRTQLLETGDEYIQEGNRWGDTYWGVCLETHTGENNLGKLIMEIRKTLSENNNLSNPNEIPNALE